ncbi:MAG: hypothetical protein WBC06_06290 [Chitinophagaceae bacterium]
MKNELSINQLMQLIIGITTEIRDNHPELYQFLDETPLFLYAENSNEIYRTDFEKYLSTITLQLQNYITTH